MAPKPNGTLEAPADAASGVSRGAVLESASRTRYVAERKLGAGAYGQVWLCHVDGAPRAVKLLPVDGGAQSMAREVEQSKRATEAAGPHCVPKFHEASEASILGQPGQLLLIAMEFIDGVNAGRLKERGPVPEAVTRTILIDVATGLGRLHQCGVVHRDVKGENTLVSKSGSSYLCDFGISAYEQELRGVEGVAGTPYFMAPELLGKVPRVTDKADVWAFGIMAIELATGKVPWEEFRRATNTDIMELVAMCRSPTAPLEPGYTQAFVNTVNACLTRDTTQRPSIQELLNDEFMRAGGRQGHVFVKGWLESTS